MISALILVPEITKGMKSIGSKSLLEIKKNLSVLDYQIQSIKNIDKNIKIIVCTGFESEKIISIITKNYNNIQKTTKPL
jgi:choline kinase